LATETLAGEGDQCSEVKPKCEIEADLGAIELKVPEQLKRMPPLAGDLRERELRSFAPSNSIERICR
jgi:hypothetical protein